MQVIDFLCRAYFFMFFLFSYFKNCLALSFKLSELTYEKGEKKSKIGFTDSRRELEREKQKKRLPYCFTL